MNVEAETGVIVVIKPQRKSFLILNKTEYHTPRHRKSHTSLSHRWAELNAQKTTRRLQVDSINLIVPPPFSILQSQSLADTIEQHESIYQPRSRLSRRHSSPSSHRRQQRRSVKPSSDPSRLGKTWRDTRIRAREFQYTLTRGRSGFGRKGNPIVWGCDELKASLKKK
jgi:hypothetical protein